jgi:hypothetical protein
LILVRIERIEIGGVCRNGPFRSLLCETARKRPDLQRVAVVQPAPLAHSVAPVNSGSASQVDAEESFTDALHVRVAKTDFRTREADITFRGAADHCEGLCDLVNLRFASIRTAN